MNIIKKVTPNFTVGREGKKPNKIIIHWIGAGDEVSTVNWFANPAAKVSAHYLVADDRIYQFVDEKDTAWQAGDWTVNTESIGIEHEATPTYPMTDSSYKTSGALVKDICNRWSIPIDREHIKKHSEIKATQCPGTIDMDRIINIAKGENTENLANEISELKISLNTLQVKYAELEIKYAADLLSKQNHIESLQKSGSETTAQLILARQATESAKETSDALELKLGALEKKLSDLGEEMGVLQETITKTLETVKKREEEIKNLKEKLDLGLKGYSKWELFVALIRK